MPHKPNTQAKSERFVPLHEQIYLKLRQQVVEGKLKVGQKLPTEEQLCASHAASRITIRRALDSLTADELITRSPRRGTFVISNSPRGRAQWTVDTLDDIVQLGEHSSLELISYTRQRLPANDAVLLRESVGFRLRAIRCIRGRPVAFTSILLPSRIGRELRRDDFKSTTIYALLGRLGQEIGSVRERIAACPAPRSIAKLLGCGTNAPLLATERLYLDARSRPVELARSWYLHEAFSIHRQIPVREHRGGAD